MLISDIRCSVTGKLLRKVDMDSQVRFTVPHGQCRTCGLYFHISYLAATGLSTDEPVCYHDFECKSCARR